MDLYGIELDNLINLNCLLFYFVTFMLLMPLLVVDFPTAKYIINFYIWMMSVFYSLWSSYQYGNDDLHCQLAAISVAIGECGYLCRGLSKDQ